MKITAALALGVLMGMGGVKTGFAEDVAARQEAVLAVLAQGQLPAPGGTGKLPYGIAAAQLALGAGNTAQASAYVAASGTGGEPAFNALYLLRAYLDNAAQFDAAHVAAIGNTLAAVDDWNPGYTENHGVLLWATAYLAAQRFTEQQWHWAGGQLSSAQVEAQARQALMDFGRRLYRVGYADYLSPVYDAYKMAAWMAVYDHAQDAEMRTVAEAVLAWHSIAIALASVQEVVLPPYSRDTGAVQDNALAANIQWVHWLYWGLGGATGVAGADPTGAEWLLALSDWRPPAVADAIATGAVAYPFEVRTQQPYTRGDVGGYMLRTTWREAAFGLSTGAYRWDFAQLADYGVRQTVDDTAFGLAWTGSAAVRQVSVMHPYWHAEGGVTQWSGLSSPFMRAGQAQGAAVLLFDIPAEDPYADAEPWSGQRVNPPLAVAALRIPRTGISYDGSWGEDWHSIDAGSTFIAIKALKPGLRRDRRALMSAGFDLLLSEGTDGQRWQTGFVIDVVSADAVASLEAFMAQVMAQPLQVDWQANSVEYTTYRGQTLRVDFASGLQGLSASLPAVWVAGQPLDFAQWGQLQSPFSNLEDAVLQVAVPGATAPYTVDWSGGTPIIGSEAPQPTHWAEWPIVTDGWVNTGDFIGWIFPVGDYVRSFSLNRYIYLPERGVGDGGAWFYAPR